MTLRECMKAGRRGNFGAALLALVEQPSITTLSEALARADDGNIAAIERALPGALAICRTIYNDWPSNWAGGLKGQFRALPFLDEEVENPFAIDLKTGEGSRVLTLEPLSSREKG